MHTTRFQRRSPGKDPNAASVVLPELPVSVTFGDHNPYIQHNRFVRFVNAFEGKTLAISADCISLVEYFPLSMRVILRISELRCWNPPYGIARYRQGDVSFQANAGNKAKSQRQDMQPLTTPDLKGAANKR